MCFVGVETALHLATQGKDITIVEALPEIAMDMESISKIALARHERLFEKHKIKVLTNAIVVEIKKN
jgi:pyruvate/2-oxoglutarate dehydrogenase complex dihydrolipoamide dehydrogenase (E3) component